MVARPSMLHPGVVADAAPVVLVPYLALPHSVFLATVAGTAFVRTIDGE